MTLDRVISPNPNGHYALAMSEPRNRFTLLIPALVIGMTFAGCAAQEPPARDSGATPSAKPSAPATAEAAAESDLEACAIVADTLTPTLDIVTAMVEDPTGQSVNPAEVSSLADQLKKMLDLSTAKMDAYAAPYASVVVLLDDIFEGRAGTSQNVDTGAYRDATVDIMSYCVDEVGYSANR